MNRENELEEYLIKCKEFGKLEAEIKMISGILTRLNADIDWYEQLDNKELAELLTTNWNEYNLKLVKLNLQADKLRHEIHIFEYEQAIAD